MDEMIDVVGCLKFYGKKLCYAIYRIRQNFRGGKLSRFSRFFSQSRKFSP